MDIHHLLEVSIKLKASDLHLSPGLAPLLRIDGELKPIPGEGPLDAAAAETLIYSFMPPDQLEEFKQSCECDFGMSVSELGRFRVNVFLQANGVAAVLRTIPATTPTLENLGAPPIFKKILEEQNGLILITGPTVSGKSTTLAA